MEDLYYIPIRKEGNGFIQSFVLEEDEMAEYHIMNYKKVIDKYFIEDKGIVQLRTGKYYTKIFKSKKNDDVYFCVVTKYGFPDKSTGIIVDDDYVDELKEHLSIKVRNTEGIINDQIIDIYSDFVTPRIKFLDTNHEEYYHQKYFTTNYIIFGAPGSGKTTVLRKLTLDYIYESFEENNRLNRLPIYIQLRDFNFYSHDFDTYIENCIKNSFSTLEFQNKYELVKSGCLYLMLDGADEIDFEKFQSFKSTITNYKRKYPQVSFIITSRPDRSFDNIEDFKKCYIQPFNANQIKELTFRKFSKDNKWQDFISILNTTPSVYEVLKNPLLLTISHFLYSHKSILPINSGQLIKELVTVLVSDWDSRRNVERKLANQKVSPLEITNLLGKLALILSEKQKVSLNIGEISNIVEGFESVSDLETYLNYIQFSTGIIKNESNKWAFSHKSLQDYFCSSFLVESLGELDKKLFIDKNWDEILRMVAGLSSDPNYLINYILNSTDRTDTDKLMNTLSIYHESHLLTKSDIRKSFLLLEKYLFDFEKQNNIGKNTIDVSEEEIKIKLGTQFKGLNEIINLFLVIFKIRFTKYEYNFYDYFKYSKSNILKSISDMTLQKGNLIIESSTDEIIIRHKEVFPK